MLIFMHKQQCATGKFAAQTHDSAGASTTALGFPANSFYNKPLPYLPTYLPMAFFYFFHFLFTDPILIVLIHAFF